MTTGCDQFNTSVILHSQIAALNYETFHKKTRLKGQFTRKLLRYFNLEDLTGTPTNQPTDQRTNTGIF